MNSNPTRSHNSQTSSSASSFNNYQFDFGLPSSGSSSTARPLKDQKQPLQNPTHSFFSSSSSSSWTPNKPSWTQQPSAAAAPPASRSAISSNATSMVGDIFGKSWNASAPTGPGTRIGLSESKNPNLFGDLVGSALGQAKYGGNVPLKDAAPKSSYSMGGLKDSLPKVNDPMKSSGGFAGNLNNNGKGGGFSVPAMNSGSTMNSNKDPFASLGGFGSKASQPIGNSSASKNTAASDIPFGDFQAAQKTGASNFSPIGSNSSNSSNSGVFPKMGDWGARNSQSFTPQNPPPQSKGVDPLDMLFSSTAPSASAAGGSAKQEFSEMDDWGMDSEIGGNDAGGMTELDGLPPPPAGVTASMAKNKGMDNQKQGQYADAIKWLSWAVTLLEKAGDDAGSVEVLSCRASCYKEVGEYKKAVADCSKVLEHDSTNVSVLLQRALLYESSEKYKLGADDLRTVLKIDPSNRLARSTIHRLAKMAD
ncbi:hypothetical protein MRB53_031775 [Persea americana]|uniref:Uncharacterized protein n=1 Tax=Persea americana TaxID=3435 RepID=A0ACC2KPY1_PERAE|nr:hypothetical protein MRB53_031775 [Persea americana]|eukprot:TRINITY_DN11911_c0_g1_i2.p1 TRINITY_DN11911_c0_g1~~TRINITY_DN11911_c0_g1_i2.p1  ORF type:complete len:477 (+),score=97.43 TRINITY_DN11911_c0_g1_i2:121-1551(+)